ncbi:hypothetical protein [Mycobacteroides abscessus]|uniref:hypothetical protein n=1 Tax=Mycobacteroides abscessus TaxID=36809 RepID=UPI0009A64553|nr:hypothetical protein [Mycobacteroides abscessus]MBE5502876.1 hypothetical protein [Mycobacteroides abscessus]SLF01876.1 Uncharacterised protein [Mycobacteroides abscessus subsp. massiliense]
MMGKWIATGLLALVGLSLLGGQYTLIGLLMLGIAGFIVFLSLRGSGSSRYSPPVRPAQLSSARFDAREELADAERRASKLIRRAEKNAEEEGCEALRAAMQFLSQEARWV